MIDRRTLCSSVTSVVNSLQKIIDDFIYFFRLYADDPKSAHCYRNAHVCRGGWILTEHRWAYPNTQATFTPAARTRSLREPPRPCFRPHQGCDHQESRSGRLRYALAHTGRSHPHRPHHRHPSRLSHHTPQTDLRGQAV